MYDSKYSFSDYSFTTKYRKLLSFYHRLNEFTNLVPRKKKQKTKERVYRVYENAVNLYNTLLSIYFQ